MRGLARKRLFRGTLILFFWVQIISVFPQVAEREIKLKIVVDEEFREVQDWRPIVKRVIAGVNDLYRDKFGLVFQIEAYSFWASDDRCQTVFELLNDLRKKVSNLGYDIVVGFTGQRRGSFNLLGGANYLRNYVIVRRIPAESLMILTLAHELAHLFGAVDLVEPGSIMNHSHPGEHFDAFSSKLIMLNRDRVFLPPYFPLPREKIDEAIKVIIKPNY